MFHPAEGKGSIQISTLIYYPRIVAYSYRGVVVSFHMVTASRSDIKRLPSPAHGRRLPWPEPRDLLAVLYYARMNRAAELVMKLKLLLGLT